MKLVTGATGHAGAEVVRALLESGHEVRAFVRDPDKARGLFGDAVDLALGDFGDSDSVRAALEGVDDLVLSGPDDPRRVRWETSLIDAGIATGVRRIVKLSSIVAEPGAPVAFWDWHGHIERHLQRSSVSAVILRSGPYMSNVLAGAEHVVREGRLYAPAGKARVAMIDPRDVGAAAAAVVSGAVHDRSTYVLTGPRAITYAQVAGVLSAATGRDIEYIDVPDQQAKQAMIHEGLSDFAAQQVVNVFAMLRNGVAEQVTETVEWLTGRPPRDFAAFALDHARLFAPDAVGVGP
jgi:uncharacterized protein YbjT (DUF2867 family)